MLALKEIFSELEARGTQGRTTIENDADQSKITLTSSDAKIVDL